MLSQNDLVVISEEKKGKRVVLFAENKTADTLNVFLMVHAEGYRRSADKPVLIDLAPRSKIPVITLIELRNVPSSYTYELIINERRMEIEMLPEKEVIDIENALRGKLVIFTMNDCEKCELLTTLLSSERIAYSEFSIHQDASIYKQFMKFVENELTSKTRIRFPVIWNKDQTLFGYDDLEKLMHKLAK